MLQGLFYFSCIQLHYVFPHHPEAWHSHPTFFFTMKYPIHFISSFLPLKQKETIEKNIAMK